MTEEPVQTTLDGRTIHCDECGKPLRRFDAVYSLAYNEEKATGRHYSCHTPLEDALRGLRDTVKRMENELNSVKEKLR